MAARASSGKRTTSIPATSPSRGALTSAGTTLNSVAGGGVVVETPAGRYAAAKLVVTAGPWAGRLLASLGAPLTVMRQVVCWFGTRDDALFRRDVFPIFIAETAGGEFYGVPAVDPD